MSSEELSRMSKKTHSPISNSELEKYIEAKKCDDFIFENRDFEDDRPELNCLNRGSVSSPNAEKSIE